MLLFIIIAIIDIFDIVFVMSETNDQFIIIVHANDYV